MVTLSKYASVKNQVHLGHFDGLERLSEEYGFQLPLTAILPQRPQCIPP
jgi:hypothetical protein